MLTPERLEQERQRVQALYKSAGKSPSHKWLTGASCTYYESTVDVHRKSGYNWNLDETISVKSSTIKKVTELVAVTGVIGVCIFIFIDPLWLKLLALLAAGFVGWIIYGLFHRSYDDRPYLKIGKEGIQPRSFLQPLPWHYFVSGWIKTVDDNESSSSWLIIHYYDEPSDDFRQTEISFNDLNEDAEQLAIWIETFRNSN